MYLSAKIIKSSSLLISSMRPITSPSMILPTTLKRVLSTTKLLNHHTLISLILVRMLKI